ncbi:MAG: eukaryotic-like serine/threonine-protein kinase [Candidatus Sumerlaeota bacterium]|nr:eukaryotic-like serine/threonine-protein kinase [Candidatus Sumerlaeota bacterium]
MLHSCPSCHGDIPGPEFRRGRGTVRIRCKVCGTMLSVPRTPEINQEMDSADFVGKSLTLKGIEVLGVLGRGGMGMVYSAVRLADHELLAIKVLPPECLRYPELIQRFDFEAQMMAQLSHPGIVQIIDRGHWEDHPYIVMDYVPGINLKTRIERGAPLPIDEVLAIASPVAEALQRCHEAGMVHRDLKPANVLLSQSGRVLVTDFGIANLIHLLGDQTDHGVSIGTPQYVAPEQLRDGSNVDTRADQYSLAVIMYEMMTRDLPAGVFDPPSRSYPELTPEAEAVLLRALSRRPADRYDSMRQFLRAFRRAIQRPANTPAPEDLIQFAATPVPLDNDEPIFPLTSASARVRIVTDEEPEAPSPAASEADPDTGEMDFEGTRSSPTVPKATILATKPHAPPEEPAKKPEAPKTLKTTPAENRDWGGTAAAVAGIGLVLGLALYLLARVF